MPNLKIRLISMIWNWLSVTLVSLGLTLIWGALPSIAYAQEPIDHPFEITLAGSAQPPEGVQEVSSRQALNLLESLPIRFLPNQGQIEAPEVRFHAKTLGGNLFFTPEAVVFALPAPDPAQPYPSHETTPQQTVVRLTFEGANPAPTIEGLQPLPGRVSFFLGNDPDRWQSDLTAYTAVVYQELYPGIDLLYRGNEGRLKSEFIVAPGADPYLIRLRYHNVEHVELGEDGSLILHTPTGQLVEAPLLIYQEINGLRHEIEGHYVLPPGDVGQPSEPVITLHLSKYDPAHPLVIDPELVYSSYLGGSSYDYIDDITLDNTGNIWLAGSTSSIDFPLKNASQSDLGGPSDVFVTQLIHTTGSYTYGYSSYLGGEDYDSNVAIVVNDPDQIYLTGVTNSENFPTTSNAIQANHDGTPGPDLFVTHLISFAGSYTYSYSSYLGGNNQEYVRGLAVDQASQIYLTGNTWSTDFPVTGNAPQGSYGGGGDVFVTQIISSGGVYTYGLSTYLGGSNDESSSSLALNDGHIYIGGYTNSTNFPSTPNALQQLWQGSSDAFVTQIVSSGEVYTYGLSTYLGGNGLDYVSTLTVNDNDGSIYVGGFTGSTDFFTTPDALQGSYGGGSNNGFITQIITTGGVYTYGLSTYLPGVITSSLILALDDLERIYVSGSTESADYPTTSNALQSNFGGGLTDGFLMQIIKAAGVYTYGYSSYLGGDDYEFAVNMVIDSADRLYLAGFTSSTDFPTTPNAIRGNLTGPGSDGFITVLDFLPPNLNLLKQVSTSAPIPGQRLTYTLIISNSSESWATGVSLSDTLPAGLSFAGPVTIEGTTGTVAQDAGDLPALASGLAVGPAAVVTVTFPVTVTIANSTLTNTASVTSAEITVPQTASVAITAGSDTQPPTPPILITPTGSITLSLLRPTFDWTDSTDNMGVISYTLILTREGNSSHFTSTVSEFTPSNDLISGSYIWTVIAYDAAGNSSALASPANFAINLVDLQPPTKPVLITPTGDITLNLTRPRFDWTDATDNTGVVSYTLILTGTGSSSTWLTNTLSSFTPTLPLSNRRYTWTVIAHDVAGNVSLPAQPETFRVAFFPPIHLPLILKP